MRETTRYIPDVREWAYDGEYDFLTEGIEDDSDSELFSDSESEAEPEHNSDEDEDDLEPEEPLITCGIV